jgi:hypothetical protein
VVSNRFLLLFGAKEITETDNRKKGFSSQKYFNITSTGICQDYPAGIFI